MSRPLVSIVTPTWQRPELLAETLRHVREQDYPEMAEHMIVSDGLDMRVEQVLDRARLRTEAGNPQLFSVQLGRNWSGLMPSSFGVAPLLVGYLAAHGDLIMPWCDDERALTSDHVSRLVDLLESSGADFAYPKVRIWRVGDPDGPETAIIGTDPPRKDQITHYLFRASCLWRFGMPRWGTHPVDWSLVAEWMAQGAIWAMLDDCTFTHRLDQ